MFLITFIIIKSSPGFFPLFLPDSYDYVKFENSSSRNILYPAFYLFITKLNLDITNTQISILTFSICFLVFILNLIKIKKFLIFLFWVVITFNFYYTSFSKTILPESIFFSLLNLSLGFLILTTKSKKNYSLLFLSLTISLLAIIKKIGIVLSISFIIYFVMNYGTKKKN